MAEAGVCPPAYGRGMETRKATVADVHELATAMPDVVCDATAGGRPVFQVHRRSFVFFRGPRKDAVDEVSGERLEDVVMVVVPTAEDKQAILQSGPPWFTTPHFDGYNAVLVREAHLGLLTRAELEEVICDAWLAKAPKRLARAWLDEHRPG